MQRSCSHLDLDTMLTTKAHVAANPDDGKGAFETVTEWRDGAVAVTRARSFTIETDEPAPLGGTDSAIDPMELLLASLGTCLTIGWVTHANQRGVDFRDLKITVRAPYDLRGYLGLDRAVRPGFTRLEYDVEVDSDADAGRARGDQGRCRTRLADARQHPQCDADQWRRQAAWMKAAALRNRLARRAISDSMAASLTSSWRTK